MMSYGLGYIPDLPDQRDWRHVPPGGAPIQLPPLVDLRTQSYPKPCYNQGSVNSCTANSVGAMFGFVDRKQGGSNINPSRRQLYYDARAYDGLQAIDQGAYIRSALRAITDRGVADESLFPYDVVKINEQPPQNVYEAALNKQALAYLRVDITVDAFRACLAESYPFVVGTTLYQNYYDAATTGRVRMPVGPVIGGHAQMFVGYSDTERVFIVQGSWGSFGDNGFVYMPYDYAASENFSADAWTIRSLEEVVTPPPPPQLVPVITYVSRYKEKKQMVVVDADNTDLDAALLIDGKRVASGHDGVFTAKHLGLTAGGHILVVQNGSGAMSRQHVLTV